MLAKPGSITPHTKFTAEIYVLSKDEGGRHTPFFNGYRPQFYFRTTDVTGSIELPAGTEMVMPGDNVSITVSLIAPIAMEEGLRFAIREGGTYRRRRRRRQSDRVRETRGNAESRRRRGGFHPAPVVNPSSLPMVHRPIAQLVERRSPKPKVGGSRPSWPAACWSQSKTWLSKIKLGVAALLVVAGVVGLLLP